MREWLKKKELERDERKRAYLGDGVEIAVSEMEQHKEKMSARA